MMSSTPSPSKIMKCANALSALPQTRLSFVAAKMKRELDDLERWVAVAIGFQAAGRRDQANAELSRCLSKIDQIRKLVCELNDVKISVGEDCLLGANSGLGIPLGDRCIIEAGLYLTGGTKVEVLDKDSKVIHIVKASELSSKPDLLFIRNSLSGAVQCRPNKSDVLLNDQLHKND